MLDLVCRLDAGLGVPVMLLLMIAMCYSMFMINFHGSLAEPYVDTDHWAGGSGTNWLQSFVFHSIRFNTGLGYTPQGRRIWWQGYRFALMTHTATITASLVAVWHMRQCS
ncbi:MAG: hypothetical protein AAGF81_12525 [Pseudomonadota bacterium]